MKYLCFCGAKKNFEKAEVQLLNQGTSAMNLAVSYLTVLLANKVAIILGYSRPL